MARLLVECLKRRGFQVDIASRLRAFLKDPDDADRCVLVGQQADQEIKRLTTLWTNHGAPDLWFCYHPYYKSPDLIGPELCTRFNIPYVTAEASYSERRSQGVWASTQEALLISLEMAAVNICFTDRDRAGLRRAIPKANSASLRPFIDPSMFTNSEYEHGASHLVAVAMMRSGDKMESYRRLAAALQKMLHVPWTLSLVGEGPLQKDVEDLFAVMPAERVRWHGLLTQPEIATIFARGALYVWPGCGEAYGLAYLEAQAAGLPVVAYRTAGVPEVVEHQCSGLMTPAGDDEQYADAISSLLCNPTRLKQMSDNAVAKVNLHHSIDSASVTLGDLLQRYAAL